MQKPQVEPCYVLVGGTNDFISNKPRSRHDHMVVGFTTTCTISTDHH
jgi:hypothetical protein